MNVQRGQKIRVACVGTGYFSRFHYQAWQRIERVDLCASMSPKIRNAERTGLPAYDKLETMLREMQPDLLDIISPPDSHLDLIQRTTGSTVATIICQKPFCRTIEEAEQSIALCKQAGIKLIVHENFRFQPWYRKMKEIIDKGVLGDIHQLTFRLRTGDGQGPQAYLDRQPYFQEMPKFLIHETGVHWIDTFRFLLGKPFSVYADLRQMNPAIAGEDAGYFIMEFDGKRQALFDANRHLDHGADDCRTTLGEAMLEGTKGTVTLDGAGELRHRTFGSRTTRIILPSKPYEGFAGDCVHALQSHVVSGLLGENPIENLASDYLEVLAIEAAIYQSAETGTKVKL